MALSGCPTGEPSGTSFASPPKVVVDGANVHIDFEVSRATDVAVEVLDARGETQLK